MTSHGTRLANSIRGEPDASQKYACDTNVLIPIQFESKSVKAIWCRFHPLSETEGNDFDFIDVLKGPARGKAGRGNVIAGKNPEESGPGADQAARLVRLQGKKSKNNFPGCGPEDNVNPNRKFPGRELELRW